MTSIIDFIRLHSFELLIGLFVLGATIPAGANISISILRKRSKAPGDFSDRAARFIAAKAPLVQKAVYFAEDLVMHPTELTEKLSKAGRTTTDLEDNPTTENIARVIAAVREVVPATDEKKDVQ